MESLLLEICGKELYFDVDRLSDICKIEEDEPNEDQMEDIIFNTSEFKNIEK